MRLKTPRSTARADDVTLPLFAPTPRTFRVRRDLRREALLPDAPTIPAAELRAKAIDDDRTLSAWLADLAERIERERGAIAAALRPPLSLVVKNGGLGARTYVRDREGGTLTRRPDSRLLKRRGATGITKRIKALVHLEERWISTLHAIECLAQACAGAEAAISACQRRRYGRDTQTFWWPHEIRKALAKWPTHAPWNDVPEGPFCPTPHAMFECWRLRMVCFAEALKSYCITLNRCYNLRRRRHRPGYGRPRKAKFGLVAIANARGRLAGWLLPRLAWRLIVWGHTERALYATRARKRIYSRSYGWRELDREAPVARDSGRLNATAVSMCNQPEMYPLLLPVDFAAAVFNEAIGRVVEAAEAVMGTRPSKHPYGGAPRQQWPSQLAPIEKSAVVLQPSKTKARQDVHARSGGEARRSSLPEIQPEFAA